MFNLSRSKFLPVFVVDRRFTVPFTNGQTFLRAAEAAGVAMPADCREGKCGKCEVEFKTDSGSIRIKACVEPAVADAEISRISDPTPTYFQEKTFTKREREKELKQRSEIKAARDRDMGTVEAMKARAKKFEEVSGVSLKDDDDDEEEPIDWSKNFAVSDHAETARRCIQKLRAVNPEGMSVKRFQQLLKTIPGYIEAKDVAAKEEDFRKSMELWKSKRQEEIDKVTFDNCASYEP
jgi:hypothetical protein